MHRGLVLLVLVACSQDYGLVSVGNADPAPEPLRPANETHRAHAPVAPDPAPPAPLLVHEVTVGGGAPTAVADYLFVVDGSASMARVLGRVLDGFDALADSGVFPSEARIAVMSTLPSDPARPHRVHPGGPGAPWLRHEPGFGDLVDGARIALFRDTAPPGVAERYGLDGCNAWFAPSDHNNDGVPCLVANTQISLVPVIVEAGLTAVGQRLDRGEPLFRTGAAANVVFVSDTHDPGVPGTNPHFDALVALRPTFAELEEKALDRQDLASFRVHAIAPASLCSSEDWTAGGPSYFEAAEASGGEILDVCAAEPADYVDLVRRIAVTGAVPQRPVVPLADDVEVAEVRVDGAPTVFTVSRDGRAVVLPGRLPTVKQQVEVRYRLRETVRPLELRDTRGR